MFLYKAAKLAKFRAKSKQGLIAQAKRVLKRYGLQATKEEILTDAGITVFNLAMEGQKAKKYCWAKKDMKNWATIYKAQCEMIALLKGKEIEGEKGATIIINEGKVEKPKKQKKAAAGVLHIATLDENK